MAIFLVINALINVIAFSCFLLHEATALWDVSYARKTREVSPTFAFVMKSPALSGQYITLLLIALMSVVIGPFIEEFIRCYKAQRTEKQTLKSASPSR